MTRTALAACCYSLEWHFSVLCIRLEAKYRLMCSCKKHGNTLAEADLQGGLPWGPAW